jgi:hypothetical protein
MRTVFSFSIYRKDQERRNERKGGRKKERKKGRKKEIHR